VPLSACLTIIEKADNIKNYLYDVLERAKALGEKMRRELDAQSAPPQSGFQVAIEEITALYERMTDEELLRLGPKKI
jgi:hypothetical protein